MTAPLTVGDRRRAALERLHGPAATARTRTPASTNRRASAPVDVAGGVPAVQELPPLVEYCGDMVGGSSSDPSTYVWPDVIGSVMFTVASPAVLLV